MTKLITIKVNETATPNTKHTNRGLLQLLMNHVLREDAADPGAALSFNDTPTIVPVTCCPPILLPLVPTSMFDSFCSWPSAPRLPPLPPLPPSQAVDSFFSSSSK